ncbi:hypothetical protein G647_06098 [Cladophialophora carrionii CBS 160.54]|uniref:Protein MON2 homolog n=1 Tax=Cladophialophora carrionii CBS 160.54 TaxID=1279043 RepID=V9D6W4_9EURO|nr:uncharacterized protein G647_06098 [Cladophialophora carrionii CBS 160.54]ETI22028.1 hypothetical protein G647_06098 [Cladophialophora carrionii CBS 160.54]
MTHAFLQSELTSLISDSKRKYNDVRAAAERALGDIKAISVTSETQLAGDLCRKPQFVDPFILACKSKNARLVTTGTACLHRLTASRAVPRTRLPDVLDAFQDAIGAGYEPQLKVLQTLPSLLQLYVDDIRGEILARILELCAVLQSSKTAVVSNTAAATFQQLVSTVFENGERKDRTRTSGESETPTPTDRYQRGEFSVDAVALFEDFCLLLDQQKPRFLRIENLPSAFLLETLHTILASHDSLLRSEKEPETKWSERLLHGLSRSLVRKDNFGITVRALSILLLIFRTHGEGLQHEVAEVVPLLVGALEKDGNPPWRRSLYLEFFRSLFSDFNVLRETFAIFDSGEEPVKLVGQVMSALVRIGAEDPSLIGLGRQSTVPIQRTNDPRSDEAASIEAQGLGGAITAVASNDSNTTGLGAEWSLIAVPLMEQPDKSVAPAIPSTYIYTLVLDCVSSFCDGLSKFVMPLSVPSRASQRENSEMGRRDSSATDRTDDEPSRKPTRPSSSSHKYQRLINPLTLANHRLSAQIRTSADMIEACWPAALATCSTFLNSAMDAEFYHALIRSVQKLAQVSGVLELSTPRDALLTTLAKASSPANASSIIASYQTAKNSRFGGAEHSDVSNGLKSPTDPPPTPTFQGNSSPLNVRHLLCLRALLNLGIALGPTLKRDAWFILIETMQTVEALIAMPTTSAATSQSGSPRIGASGNDGHATLATEIAAVQAATKRMLESTRSFGADSFTEIVQALLRLLGQNVEVVNSKSAEQPIASPTTPGRLGARPGHQTSRSVSGLWTKSKTLELEVGFVLSKLSDLSRINLYRFASSTEQACSWILIGDRLLRLSRDTMIAANYRIQAASILDLISMETVKLLDDSRFEAAEADAIRLQCLRSLLQQLDSFQDTQGGKHDEVELEIHKRLLDALESMLSHSGESLSNCWPIALEILSVTSSKRGKNKPELGNATIEQAEKDAQTAQILRVAFRSIQLIASDFLDVLDSTTLANLAHLLRQFGSQQYDLNVALTSTTVLWSLASHVLTKIDRIDVETMPNLNDEDEELLSQTVLRSGGIWSNILLELVGLCKDERADVRNAAIRVLLKMLDASSEHLSSSTWAISLRLGPFETIRYCIRQYAANKTDQEPWMASAAQLTDGCTQLLCHNLNVIAQHDGFKDTWLRIMDVLKSILNTNSVSASSLAFSNLSKLLSALADLPNSSEELVQPAVQLWATYQPGDIRHEYPSDGRPGDEPSNQQAFSSHAHVLVEAYKTSSVAISKFLQGQTSTLMDSIERGVMLCTHPPYTSDVKTLAPEQKEASDCLAILKILLQDDVSKYAEFLLRLVTLTLNIRNGKVVVQQKKSALSKSIQQPSFIAFTAACLDKFRDLILECADDDNFIQTVAVQNACPVLSAVVSTKYTRMPTNNEMPLWRKATVIAAVMLEALQKHVRRGSSKDLSQLESLAAPIISIAVSILQPGDLSNPPGPEHKEATILEDETFDIEHFELLHKAIVPIFQNVEAIKGDACKQYAIALFKVSLLTKPWFYDLPDDVASEPLKDLMRVRPGSVHRPVFAVRRQICHAALRALFDLVERPQHATAGEDEREKTPTPHPGPMSQHKLASAAAPYLILRVVHPLKTFLADQRLRSLTPPPMAQQVELQVILSKFVDLRSNGHAMADMMMLSSSPRAPQTETRTQGDLDVTRGNHPSPSDDNDDDDDGKEHLRVLYGLMLRVHTFWQGLPRLKGPGARAWQDDEPGRGIQDALERWQRVVAEGWGFAFAGLE